MKRKLLIALTVFCMISSASFAQQRPHYTQYVLNNYIINPAVAGIENYVDAKISHRQQWVGLQDAPLTTYITIHGPIRKSDYERETPTTFHAAGENPRGRAYWQDYSKAEPHQGIGMTIINDRTGPLNRFAVYGTYAYHLGISARTTLSGGISAGVQNMTLNASKLQFDIPVDPAVAGSGYLNRLSPDISAGLFLYSSDYYLGLAAQQIVPSKLRFSDDTLRVSNGKNVPHLFFQAGYRMFLSDDISLLPSAVIKYVSPLPVGFDVNLKLQYQDLVWVGASYRHQDSYSGMVGVNISSALNIGYSYDITTSRLNTVSRNSHEIVIGFLLGNRYGDWCPRNLW